MKTLAGATPFLAILAACSSANGAVYNGIEFPQGAASFADSVVSFTPGPGPAAAFLEPQNALGIPDVNFSNGSACFAAPGTTNCKFTSLGEGGSLTLRFTDNVLTGSSASGTVTGIGDSFDDVYIFEVGVAESSRIEISADGSTWHDVGSIGGGGIGLGVFSYGFDIDKLGFGITDSFTYVRVTDLQIDPGTSPQGADIDAIGAIQTVPLPGAAWLLPTGALLIRWTRRRST